MRGPAELTAEASMGLREAPAQTACLVPLAFALGLTLLGRKEHLAELRWAGGQCWAPNTGSQGWLEEREVNPSGPAICLSPKLPEQVPDHGLPGLCYRSASGEASGGH